MCIIFLKLKNLTSESPKVVVQCQAALSLGCDSRADCNAALQWWVPWPMPHSVILTSRESKKAMTLQPTNSSKGRFQSSDLKPPATSTQENPILPCKQSSYPSGKTSWKERLTQPGSICSLASPAASKPESSSHSNWVCSWLQLPRNPKLSGTTQPRPAWNKVHNLFWVTRVAGNLSYSHL